MAKFHTLEEFSLQASVLRPFERPLGYVTSMDIEGFYYTVYRIEDLSNMYVALFSGAGESVGHSMLIRICPEYVPLLRSTGATVKLQSAQCIFPDGARACTGNFSAHYRKRGRLDARVQAPGVFSTPQLLRDLNGARTFAFLPPLLSLPIAGS